MSLTKKYYTNKDKDTRGNFYIGLISKVFQTNAIIQVENLSLLNNRKINLESIYPGSINYIVVIDNYKGLFLGRVYQSQVKSSDSVHEYMYSNDKEKIFPEISLDIIGIININEKIELPGIKNVDIGDKVYFANKDIVNCYFNNLSYEENDNKFILKNIAKISNKYGNNFSIGMNSLFDKHLIVVGATNSGKSTSSLKIIDEIIDNKKKMLVIDPTGEYKDTFSKNDNFEKYTLGDNVFFPISKVTMSQWSNIFSLNDNTQGPVTYKAIQSLQFIWKSPSLDGIYQKKGKSEVKVQNDLSILNDDDLSFDLSKLSKQVREESVKLDNKSKLYYYDDYSLNNNSFLQQKIDNVLKNSSILSFFNNDANKYNLIELLDEFISKDVESLYIDASLINISDSIGSWIVNLISNHLINKKKSKIEFPFIIFIDEAHRYIYHHHNNGLESIAREGRKKGIFLFLTTQNPSDLPKNVISQIGSIISHRITSSDEIDVIKNLLKQNSSNKLKKLNRGEAILSSVNIINDIDLIFNKSKRNHNNQTNGFY